MNLKRTLYILAAVVLIGLSSCLGSKTGKLTVECVPLIGETVDVNGMKVELHTNAAFNFPVMTTNMFGSAILSSAQFLEIDPNTYYCRAWKDVNANSIVDPGDIYAFHTEPIEVLKGDKLIITMEAYLVK